MAVIEGYGDPNLSLSADEVRDIIRRGTPADLYKAKRVLVLTPDATRTCPLPMMIKAIHSILGPESARLDFMVALGTHPPMPQSAILDLYGITTEERETTYQANGFYNHRWDLPATLQTIGRLTKEEVSAFADGRLQEEVPVKINRRIFEYDLVLILGPVFPHEVVGFSGGAKYLFPGISGGDFLHFFHWLGAVITCAKIIGIKKTPVRDVIHHALAMVNVPLHNLSMVVRPGNRLCGLFVGDVQTSWSAAADLSARIHIKRTGRTYRTVLGRAPSMYDEIWVAGKVMYKLEQVVADGGRLIIYGPHITQVSRTWGTQIEQVGYHVRDYFLDQMHRFENVPLGVLAHSTHVRGSGSYHQGVEKPRVDVILATAIPEATCRRINLGYMAPDSIDVDAFRHREEEGVLFVDHAGEILYTP